MIWLLPILIPINKVTSAKNNPVVVNTATFNHLEYVNFCSYCSVELVIDSLLFSILKFNTASF